MSATITREVARKYLAYNAETGKLSFKERYSSDFVKPGYFRRWNELHAGKEIGYLQPNGYLSVCVLGVNVRSSRAIFLIQTDLNIAGMVVDHLNGNRSDDRWENLRLTTGHLNQRNRKMNKNNKSGFSGVYQVNDHRWRANCGLNGKVHILGYLDTPKAAYICVQEFRTMHGFTQRHGKAA